MTMMTVDLRSFQDKVGDSFDQKGVFKGLYEFRHTDIEFFEDQIEKIKSVCYAMYKKIDEKEKQADEKIAEEKKKKP